jgi:hypothetical protein
MLRHILFNLQSSEYSVDVVPSFALFERNLDVAEIDLTSTLVSFRRQIMERVDNYEPNDENMDS